MESVTAGFWFGAFVFASGWIFWIPVGLLLFFESLFMTKRVAEFRSAKATFLLLLLLGTLHLFGVVDVITLFRQHYLRVLAYVAGSLGFGLLVYSPIVGWLSARKNISRYTAQLKSFKQNWLDGKRREFEQANGGSTSHSDPRGYSRADSLTPKPKFDPASVEQEWQTNVKPEAWADIKSVENDKERVWFWTVFWPLHFVWKCVFQWFTKLEELFELGWSALRGIAQRIKDHALRGADEGV